MPFTELHSLAGTIFHSTRLLPKLRFRAVYRLPQSKGGAFSLEFARRLGVTRNTARKMAHKSMQVMYAQEARQRPTGEMEMDDASGGGERTGERGRSFAGKVPFVAGRGNHR